VHSLVDLATDVVAVFGLRMAAKPRDVNHPYGHHKFSSLSSLLIALALLIFSALLIIASVRGLQAGAIEAPGPLAVAAAVLSLAVKEGLFWATRRIARRDKSLLLLTNAWHHRMDAVSSLLVLVALVAIAVGGADWAFLDRALGVILGAWLAFEGFRLARGASADLLDAAPGQTVLDDLREHVLPIPGVVAYHDFRARRVGDMVEIDLHVQVPPEKTVDDGHEIARKVRRAIMREHPEVITVLVHIEPARSEHLREQGISDYDPEELPR